MLTAASSQEQVDAATVALQAAIDNLIPTSRVNATALYEVLNTKWCWYGADHMLSTAGDPVSADNCTPPVLAALRQSIEGRSGAAGAAV